MSIKNRIIPLTEWSKHHPWPPIGGLRHLVFHSDKNGFDSVIVRIGKRVLIDEARFFEWVDRHRALESPKQARQGGDR